MTRHKKIEYDVTETNAGSHSQGVTADKQYTVSHGRNSDSVTVGLSLPTSPNCISAKSVTRLAE